MSILTNENSTERKHFRFLDSLRGIACLAVTLFHLVYWGPIGEVLPQLLPKFLAELIRYGWLGVPIFFVISGFVIAHSTRNFQGNLSSTLNFVLRRFARLAPPFWAAILSVVLLNFVSNKFIPGRIASIPSIESILFHMFFLHGMVSGLDEILIIAWTLALEMQFYVIYIAMLYGSFYLSQKVFSHRVQHVGALSIFAVIGSIFAISSLLVRSKLSVDLPFYFAPIDWYAFFIGVLVYWMLESQVTIMKLVFFLVIILAVVFYLISWNLYIAFAVIAVCIIWLVGYYNHLDNWLSGPILQYWGRISYSLYLFHTIIGPRVINILYRLIGNSPVAAIVIFIAALTMSIIVAHLIYYLVEKPSINLSRYFKISAPTKSALSSSVEASLSIQ